MKSEHRHDLKTNELGRLVAQATPFLEKYSNYILIGLGVLVVAGGAAIFISGASSGAAAGWTSMFGARGIEDYATIADKYAGKPVGAWARLSEAQANYDKGIQEAFSDREAAVSDLKKASELFKGLVNDNTLSRDLRQRALYGLARTAETTSDGNTEPAIQMYEQLVQLAQDPKDISGPKPVYQQLAQDRIDILRTDPTKDFYAWFQKQSPKPADRSQPHDGVGLPPGHPPFGEVTLPPIPRELRLPKPKSSEAEPSKDAGDGSPAAGKPAEKSAADAKTSAGDKQPAPTSEPTSKSDSADKPPQAAE
ncbi:MAG: hypothetical protein WD648_09015 [Planctomycetaceae bacterium]